jgi:membrane-associated phospholipid phosphatase
MTLRPKPTLAQLGLNRLSGLILGALVLEVAICAALYPMLGLSFVWRSTLAMVPEVAVPLAVWLYYVFEPGRSVRDWLIAQRFLVFALFLSNLLVQPQAQYVALAFNRPLIDHWLAACDAAMRVDVVALNAWTSRHPLIEMLLFRSYGTLIAQFVLPMIALGFSERDQDALWEFTFNFFLCTMIIIVIVMLFPAACPMTYYGFQPLLGQAQVARQIAAIRNGTLTLIDFDQLDGLISFPSFHTAGALMVTWAFRHKPWLLWPLIVLNTGLIAATFMLGAHYFVDVVAGALLLAGTVWLYRRVSPVLDIPRNCLAR